MEGDSRAERKPEGPAQAGAALLLRSGVSPPRKSQQHRVGLRLASAQPRGQQLTWASRPSTSFPAS